MDQPPQQYSPTRNPQIKMNDDALSLLDQVTKKEDEIRKREEDVQKREDEIQKREDDLQKREGLAAERAAMNSLLKTKQQHDQKELETKPLEIETNALKTRLDISDLKQLRDKLITRLPIIETFSSTRLDRDTILYISIQLSEEDFSVLKPYLPHLLKCEVTPDHIDHIIAESRSDNNHNHMLTKVAMLEWYSGQHNKLKDYTTIVNTIVHQNQKDLESSQLNRDAKEQIQLFSTVAACNDNLTQWGTSRDDLQIELKLLPIGLNYHTTSRQPYFSLLGTLYSLNGASSLQMGHTPHTHPKNPSISDSSYPGIFNQWYNPLLTNGTIPQLSSNPRLYFSTPHIANGDWVQFHGPGTTLFDIDGGGSAGSKFPLTLGGLCPKGKGGSFTSEMKSYDFGQTTLQSHGQITSCYQISIKWD